MKINRAIDPDDDEPEPAGDYKMSDEPLPEVPKPKVRRDPLLKEDKEKAERRQRRRRNRDADEEPPEGEAEGDEGPLVPRLPKPDILDRPDDVPPYPWWMGSAITAGIGVLLCIVPIGVITAKSGAGTGVLVIGLTAVAVVVQVAFVTALLMVVGHFFGIEYGPATEAIVKLVAVVLFVDGLTGVFTLCSPCGLMLAAILGAGAFQYLFKLGIMELLVSVAGMVAASWILNAAVVSILAKNAAKKNDAGGSTQLVVPDFVGRHRRMTV